MCTHTNPLNTVLRPLKKYLEIHTRKPSIHPISWLIIQCHTDPDSSGPRQRLLLSGDVPQTLVPRSKYPCSVCTCNVTSRGASSMCNRCSGWVHSKCSDLEDAAEYRRIKNWAWSSCSSTSTPQHHNSFYPQLQLKLPIPSPFCNSTQMASSTKRLN